MIKKIMISCMCFVIVFAWVQGIDIAKAATVANVLNELEGRWIDKAYFEGPINENAVNPLRIIITNGTLTKGFGFAQADFFEVPLKTTQFPNGTIEIVCDTSSYSGDKSAMQGDKLALGVEPGAITEIKCFSYNKEYTLVKFTEYKARYEVERVIGGIRLAWVPVSDGSAMGYNIYRAEKIGEKGILLRGNGDYTCEFIDMNVKAGATYYYSIYLTQAGEEQPNAIIFGSEKQITVDVNKISQTSNEISVFFNGEKIIFDQPPVNENGRILVPIRAIAEDMGAEVSWDSNTNATVITQLGKKIVLQINNHTIYIDDQSVTLDVSPKIIGGRTLVPIRAIAEGFGADVEWDGKQNSVYIITSK